MSKQIIHTDKAPAAIGPYSQAVRTGNLVYLAGQIPINPASMELEHAFTDQVHRVFTNLQAVYSVRCVGFTKVVYLMRLFLVTYLLS